RNRSPPGLPLRTAPKSDVSDRRTIYPSDRRRAQPQNRPLNTPPQSARPPRHRRRRNSWHDFKRQRIVRITDGAPKSHRALVRNQDLDREALILWPDLRTQELDRTPSNSITTPVAND